MTNLTPFERSRGGMRYAGWRVGSVAALKLVERVPWGLAPHAMEREVRAMVKAFVQNSADRHEVQSAINFRNAFCAWNAPLRVAHARGEPVVPLTARNFTELA